MGKLVHVCLDIEPKWTRFGSPEHVKVLPTKSKNLRSVHETHREYSCYMLSCGHWLRRDLINSKALIDGKRRTECPDCSGYTAVYERVMAARESDDA